MSTLVERLGSRTWSRLALCGVIAAGAAACSAETSRFTENSTGTLPRNGAPGNDATGSVPVAQNAPLGRVEAQPLPQQSAALPPPPAASPMRTAAAQPVPAAAGPRQAAQHAPSGGGRWEWDGGTSIIV